MSRAVRYCAGWLVGLCLFVFVWLVLSYSEEQ